MNSDRSSSPAGPAKPPACFLPVILGGDIGAYSLARAFHEAYGVRALVLSQSRTHLIADSSILANRVVARLDDESVLLSTLAAVAAEQDGTQLLLLACGDWYVRLIAEHRAELEGSYVIPYAAPELLDRLTLKDRFHALCDELGVPTARTAVVDPADPACLEGLALAFPLVAKAASSAAYHYAAFPGKRKVFFLDDRAALEEVLASLRASGYGHKLLIQELIPGDDTQMRILTTYSDQAGKVRLMACGQTLLEDRHPLAVGNPVAIVSRVDEHIMADARRLLEAVGYVGFANFDVRVDPRDGSHRFLDLNARLGRSSYYVTAAGQNVARWMVDDLLGNGALPAGVTVAREESLYTVVPRDVLLGWVADPSLRAEVRRLYAERRVHDPLANPAERRLAHRLCPLAQRMRARRAFRAARREQRAQLRAPGTQGLAAAALTARAAGERWTFVRPASPGNSEPFQTAAAWSAPAPGDTAALADAAAGARP